MWQKLTKEKKEQKKKKEKINNTETHVQSNK